MLEEFLDTNLTEEGVYLQYGAPNSRITNDTPLVTNNSKYGIIIKLTINPIVDLFLVIKGRTWI